MVKRQAETALRKAVDDLLSLNGWLVIRISVTGIPIKKGDSLVLIKNKAMRGFADLFAMRGVELRVETGEIIGLSQVIFIETKMPKNKDDAIDQKIFREKVAQEGGKYFLVRSYEDAEEQFKGGGII